MRQKFSTDLQLRQDHSRLRLSGVIDEDNSLASLTAQLKGPLLVLDLGEVERINSCGVRDWVNWLGSVEALGMKVVMTRCSPVIISQVNMVTNFCGDAIIHSFFAPYFNADTDTERAILLNTADLPTRGVIKAPEVEDADGTPLEFDDYEESYFAFIKDMQGREVPAEIADLLSAEISDATHNVAPVPETESNIESVKPPPPSAPTPKQQAEASKRQVDPALLASTAMPFHEESGSNTSLIIGLAIAGVLIVGVILWLVLGGQ